MKSMPMMARLFCRVHFLLLATGLNVNGSMAANTTSKLVCDTIQAGEDPAMLLDGRHITIGLYSGELSQLNESTGEWTGYDIDLMNKLAKTGRFTYDIISIGQSVDIDDYTQAAMTVLGDDPSAGGGADLMGQGTWRWNSARSKWAVWSVPMVSEEVQFVTRGASIEGKSVLQAMLILVEPFKWSVWLVLAGVLAGYTWMIRSVETHEARRVRSRALGQNSAEGTAAIIADRWLDKVRKKREANGQAALASYDDLGNSETITQTAYNTCVSCAGVHSENLSAPGTNALRTIHAGWIFFIFLIAEVYGSNLTAILTLGPETVQTLTGLDNSPSSCIATGCRFCVQSGAANEIYFRETYQPLNLLIVGKENIPAQIDGIIDGSCDAAELTKEDLFKWTNLEHNATRRCVPTIVGIPIVRRHRGMMAKAEKSCYITALNAVYARFATEPVDHANELNRMHFREPVCESASLEERDALALTIQDLLGAFILLGAVTLYGFGITLWGRRAASVQKRSNLKAFAERRETMIGMDTTTALDGYGMQMTQPQKTPM